MKTAKLFGFLAIAAVIGLVAATCEPPAKADKSVTRTVKAETGTITIEMVRIRAGTFTMGSPEDEPDREPFESDETQHQVKLSAFYMGKYPVTQEQYAAIMGTNPSNFKASSGGDDPAKRPVENVSWYDAIVFCNRLSMAEGLTPAYSIEGNTNPAAWGSVPTGDNSTWDAVTIVAGSTGYRLPTEAQWEYACRAGTKTPFNTGDNITTAQANYNGNYPYNGNPEGSYRERTIEAGAFAPNAWGLYDMHGNVAEWCWDWYGNYSISAQSDPTGAVSGPGRVVRGGSWYFNGQVLRSAYRLDGNPNGRYDIFGFRLARP